jgi:hypothetical protein
MTSLLVQLTVNVKNDRYLQLVKRGLTFVLIVRVVALDAALPTAEAFVQSSVAEPTVRIEFVVAVAVIAVGLGLTVTDAAFAADAAVSDPIAIAPTTATFLNFENIVSLLIIVAIAETFPSLPHPWQGCRPSWLRAALRARN